MPESLSKSQIERLGIRLVRDSEPAPADIELLHEVLIVYSEVLGRAVRRVRERLGLSPTSRIKNTGTILEKLRRDGGSWLKSMQDVAGMRIVGDFDRGGQDAVVAAVAALFGDETRRPKVVDRRVAPMFGYTAVHIIVFPEGVPVEIQVRTSWQHEWAELFEKLADRVGRGIRYGEPPDHWQTAEQRAVVAPILRTLYDTSYAMRLAIVDQAIALGTLIQAVEAAEVEMPNAVALDGYRRGVEAALADVRETIHEEFE